MNTLSMKNSKVAQITLSEESLMILKNFTKKYGTSKSVVIERALKFLAAQYHHKIYLQYVILDEENTTTTTTEPKSLYQATVEKHQEKMDEIMSDKEMDDIINQIRSHRKN